MRPFMFVNIVHREKITLCEWLDMIVAPLAVPTEYLWDKCVVRDRGTAALPQAEPRALRCRLRVYCFTLNETT